jgi:gentisate 1,2-dioxygenase
MLGNPGLAPERFATASIFSGVQIILLGEFAPHHRHSPSAVRLFIEGEGEGGSEVDG